jgi:hypothetical protein
MTAREITRRWANDVAGLTHAEGGRLGHRQRMLHLAGFAAWRKEFMADRPWAVR